MKHAKMNFKNVADDLIERAAQDLADGKLIACHEFSIIAYLDFHL